MCNYLFLIINVKGKRSLILNLIRLFFLFNRVLNLEQHFMTSLLVVMTRYVESDGNASFENSATGYLNPELYCYVSCILKIMSHAF